MAYPDRIIDDVFGGPRKMERATGVPHTTIISWRRAGCIHDKYHQLIVDTALSVDPPVVLGPEHFSNLRSAA